MDDKKTEKIVGEAIDMHFHIGPDILPRRYTVDTLVKEENGKISGVVLKSHSFPTIALINALQRKDGMKLIGSITLNYFMGGFNNSAIYASAVMSRDKPIVVWMPTIHAENHLLQNKSEYEIPPEWVRDPNFKPRMKYDLKAIKVTDWSGKLIRKAKDCLDTMAEMNCILATGHVSWREAEKLTLEALDRGIKTIVTHPMQRDIAMPLDTQKKLADKGAYIEYCYIMYLDRDNPGDYPLKDQMAAIEDIGAEQVILTSDAGQTRNPGPTESLKQYIKLLAGEGLAEKTITHALVKNPRKILEL
ncbi:MAG: hypothetical protein KKD39_06945 [Candidatus Altiarchaeota archaeon]|nr:hypothetical protein [Candidatus Altiarchaeota archaeon]